MPCDCFIKGKSCKLNNKCTVNRELCKNYHMINGLKDRYNKDLYQTELVRRLNYEIIFDFLTQNELQNHQWLINDNIKVKRDEAHQEWLMLIINELIFHQDTDIKGIDILHANDLYKKYKLKKELECKKSEEYEWKKVIEELAFHNANDSFNLCVSNKVDNILESTYGWEYFNEPSFQGSFAYLKNLYRYTYIQEFEKCYYEYELELEEVEDLEEWTQDLEEWA